MEDKDLKNYFWTPLFMVSGCSFLLFSAIMKVLDAPHVDLFLRMGLIGVGIGFLCYLTRISGKPGHKTKGLRRESPTD
jgi:hypothetical protein